MVRFAMVELGNLGLLIFAGYVVFVIVGYLLQAFGVVKQDLQLGAGFAILAAGLGMIAAFVIIVKKGFSLNVREIVVLIGVGAILVGILAFLPKLAPGIFQSGLEQLSVQVMSVVGR